MKTTWIIVLIVLLLSLLGNFVQWSRSKDKDLISDLSRNQHKIELQQSRDSLKVITASTDSIRKAEQAIRAKHDKEDSLREVGYKRERSASTAKITELQKQRTDAGIIPDEHTKRIEAEFKAQQARDSTEIATLKSSATLAPESFQREINALVTNLEAERSTSLKKDVVIKDLENEVSKEKRKGRVWKVVAVGAVLWGIVESVKD